MKKIILMLLFSISVNAQSWLLLGDEVTDTIPSAFSFTDVTLAYSYTEYTSDSVIVADITPRSSPSISVDGGWYYKKGANGTPTQASGTVSLGDTIWLTGTTGATATADSTYLTIGGIVDTFVISTASAYLTLNGVDEHAYNLIPNGLDLNQKNKIVVDTWFYSRSLSAYDCIITQMDSSSTQGYWGMFGLAGDNKMQIKVKEHPSGGADNSYHYTGALSDSIWYRFTAVIDTYSDSLAFFLNDLREPYTSGSVAGFMWGDYLGKLTVGYGSGGLQYLDGRLGKITITVTDSNGTLVGNTIYDWSGGADNYLKDKGTLSNDLIASGITWDNVTLTDPYPDVWFVDRDATGDGVGTSWENAATTLERLPWHNIDGGDSIYISGGADSTLYNAVSLMNKTIVGSGNVIITKGIDANHNGDVYISASDYTTNNISLNVQYCNNLTFEKLNILWEHTDQVGTGQVFHSSFYSKYCEGLVIDSCNISSTGRAYCVTMNNMTNITISDNVIETYENEYLNGQDNLYVGGISSELNIIGNTMILRGANTDPNGAHIDHIQFVTLGNELGESLEQTTIANNFFYYNADTAGTASQAISLQQCKSQKYLIYNNIMSSHTDGLNTFSFDVTNPDYIVSARIFNNTISNSGNGEAARPFILYGNASGQPIDTLIVKNNLIRVDDDVIYGTTNVDYSSIHIEFDNNFYQHHVETGTLAFVVESGGFGVQNFGYWQGLGYDVSSDTGAVTFVDSDGALITDYIVTTRPIGTDLSSYFIDDINGVVRSNWYMGAIEDVGFITNGTLETDLAGWTNSGSATFERNITTPINGNGDLHFITNSLYDGGVGTPFNVVAGQSYRLTCTYRAASGSGTTRISLAKTADPLGSGVGGAVAQTISNYTVNHDLDYTFTATETTTAYPILICVSGTAEIWIDDIVWTLVP